MQHLHRVDLAEAKLNYLRARGMYEDRVLLDRKAFNKTRDEEAEVLELFRHLVCDQMVVPVRHEGSGVEKPLDA